jgi:hypothetical protein
LPKQSSSNKPVRKAYKKRAPSSKTGQNKTAIMTLSRQVKGLQNSKYGDMQRHAQFCALIGSRLPNRAQPLAFLLNDLTLGSSIYQGQAPVAGIPNFSISNVLTPYTYATDLADQYEWNAKQNTELVSALVYKPIFVRFNFNIQSIFPDDTLGYRLRFSIIKLKPYNASNKVDCSLPSTLGAYRNLASNSTAPLKNNFNPTYHNVIYDKWVTIKANHTQGEYQSHNISIPFKFPERMVCRPDITSTPVAQNTWTNIPISQQYWLLVSAGDVNSDDAPTCVNLGQINVAVFQTWRDAHGTS